MATRFVFSLAAMSLSASSMGCAAMEAERLAALDRAVTVSASQSLDHYRRVGMEPSTCQGSMCGKVARSELDRQVEQAVSGACYEVVAADEIDRYARYYGGQVAFPALAKPFGIELHDKTAEAVLGAWDAMAAWSFGLVQPDVRDVVVDELGLEGIVKTNLNVGDPDSTTGFRPVTLDVRLMDAVGRQGLWQARLEDTLMENSDLGDVVKQMTMGLREALTRRASACGSPAVVAAHTNTQQQQVFSGFQVVEQKIELPDRIHFELGSAQLSARSHGLLGQVAHFLGTRPDLKRVRVEGHTDSEGADADNLTLSQQRAGAVKDFLVSQGVDASRLESQGYGETKPIAPNDTATNKARNRRVDLVIVQ